MTAALPTPAFSLPVLVCRMPVHSDFVTFPLYFWIDCDLVDSSQGQLSSWISLGTTFDVLCSQNQSCSSFQHYCTNPCSKWAFFPDSQKFLWSLPFAFSGQRGPSTDFQGQLKKVYPDCCSACTASAPLPQEMAATAQRLFLQTHFCALESVVIQPLASINELSELVNFILNEACQVNPPASVTLTNNSTFPLFPRLIISKKWQNLLKVLCLSPQIQCGE